MAAEKKNEKMRGRRVGGRDSEVETAEQRERRGGEGRYTGRFMTSCLEHTAETDS